MIGSGVEKPCSAARAVRGWYRPIRSAAPAAPTRADLMSVLRVSIVLTPLSESSLSGGGGDHDGGDSSVSSTVTALSSGVNRPLIAPANGVREVASRPARPGCVKPHGGLRDTPLTERRAPFLLKE